MIIEINRDAIASRFYNWGRREAFTKREKEANLLLEEKGDREAVDEVYFSERFCCKTHPFCHISACGGHLISHG